MGEHDNEGEEVDSSEREIESRAMLIRSKKSTSLSRLVPAMCLIIEAMLKGDVVRLPGASIMNEADIAATMEGQQLQNISSQLHLNILETSTCLRRKNSSAREI